MKRRSTVFKIQAANMTSIMDIIFIITFFLLMNANFVEIRHIISENPVFSELTEVKSSTKPLNLTVYIKEDVVRIQKGVGRAQKTIANISTNNPNFFNILQEYFVNIKKENPVENSVIIIADPMVSYDKIVHIVDRAQMIEKSYKEPIITITDAQGLAKKTRNLFQMVMFQ